MTNLPHELLIEIMLWGLDLFGPLDPFSTNKWPGSWHRPRMRYLLVVTSVCHQWRDVAISTSPLWSLFVTAGRTLSTEAACEYTETLLQRSRDTKLQLYIYWGSPFYNPNDVDAIIPIIRPHLQRCSLFHITLDDIPLSRKLLPLPGKMVHLSEIHYLRSYNSNFLNAEEGWVVPREVILSSENESQLRTLRICSRSLIPILENTESGVLTRFMLHPRQRNIPPDALEPLLSQCRNLKELYLPGVYLPEIPDKTPWILESLQSLTIQDRLLLNFPLHISCPGLKELTLIECDWDSNMYHLHPPLQPYRLLRSLTLKNFGASKFYHALNGDGPQWDPSVSTSLYSLSSMLCLFPNVEHLILEGCSNLNLVFSSMLHTIITSKDMPNSTCHDCSEAQGSSKCIGDPHLPHNDLSSLKLATVIYTWRCTEVTSFDTLRSIMCLRPSLKVIVEFRKQYDGAVGKVLEGIREECGAERFVVY